MRHIVVGKGEIGKSVAAVLGCPMVGREKEAVQGDILDITFPYTEDFGKEVRKYQDWYNPAYTVIHSTVKPGTCRQLGALHSPVIGIHPDLKESLTTFTKYLSGAWASEVAQDYRRAGMKVYLFDDQETTEVLKIMDTTFYGLCVEYTKEIKRLSQEYGFPFEAWTLWTDNYNQGYGKMGHPEFTRPNLVPMMGTIGGHCVLPNTELIDNSFTSFLKQRNA